MSKPILCLDFDGVCHSYTSGWEGADVIPDPPVPGLYDFLVEACTEFEIHIYSSRSNQEGGIDAMRAWLHEHRPFWLDSIVLENIKFPTEKPPALVSIDDRAIQFQGTWPEVNKLKNFKPWNKIKRKQLGEL